MHVHFVGESDDGMTVSSHHARALAEAGVEVTFYDTERVDRSTCRHADVVHLVTYEQLDNSLLRNLAAVRAGGVPVVRCWTGRDVVWARYHEGTRQVAQVLARLGIVQLSRTEEMVSDLGAMGITASSLPVLSLNIASTVRPEPLPGRFSILCYLPAERRRFYGGDVVDVLIRRLPNVRFLILGDTRTDYQLHGNVESLGFVEDVSRTIRRATVLVQPRLDGTVSRLALEMLCHGRHAVTTGRWRHCHHANSVEGFLKAIRVFRREQVFNLEGREEVCRAYDKRLSLAALQATLGQCAKGGLLNRRLRGGWLGVAAALRIPGVLSRKTFEPLDPDLLPPEAAAMRALLASRESTGAAAPA